MITNFRGKYNFLSNFYSVKIEMDGHIYKTVEHAYQASKTTNPEIRKQIRKCKTPGEAKRLGRKIVLRKGWDNKKVKIMASLVWCKFKNNPKLAKQLLATEDEVLVEGNIWRDRFWGATKNENGEWEGKNMLGRMLMQIRTILKKREKEQ